MKIDALRRLLLPCFSPTSPTRPPTSSATTTRTKRRLSASLQDDIPLNVPRQLRSSSNPQESNKAAEDDGNEGDGSNGSDQSDFSRSPVDQVLPPRPSKTMTIGTIFGPRRGGHVWFCVQHDRLSMKPLLLLELSIPTLLLAKEMRSSGLVRIALECSAGTGETNVGSWPLRSVPVWTLSCDGKKLGFAVKRRLSEKNRMILKTMQSISVGAGVIPSSGVSSSEVTYMRGNYEHVVGSTDSESFHLINPDECSGQELSVFLIRTR
ncbi:hypothetical protein MLD38_029840 [Melastoma candidum]|uniref:Uncharacterized protein n=1 Tax=Melastoma candidum TaxID=119954 RepID=A0ACB9N625_9MYRT|nr:hypothetical protein MLD38_029840 [Melastoma candidum]